MKTTILYQKSQISYFLVTILLFMMAFLHISSWSDVGKDSLSLISLWAFDALFVIVLLLFYKLTITIDEKSINASFGFGLIQKSLLLEEINTASIEEIDVPWYYGIGLRITPKGVLYSTRFGKAIYFKSLDNKKTFFVGTENFSEIKAVLIHQIKLYEKSGFN